MPFFKLFQIKQSERHQFCQTIIESSSPKVDFYFLVLLSTLIVTLGMLSNNNILVIGGMLVTPLLSPIMATALGIIVLDIKVIYWSLKVFIASMVLAFGVSFMTALFYDGVSLELIGLVQIMHPSWFVFIVALIAGVAASYTWAKPELNDNLPGVAITVTLVPPLTVLGIALARNEGIIFMNAFYVFLINVAGILLASIAVLLFMEFYKCKRRVIAEVKEEEKEIKGEGILNKLKPK